MSKNVIMLLFLYFVGDRKIDADVISTGRSCSDGEQASNG